MYHKRILNILRPIAILLTMVSAARAQKNNPAIVAIKNVHIITMTAPNRTTQPVTVVIQNNTIHSIDGPIPAGAKTIDVKNKWLTPRLIGIHVHVPGDFNLAARHPATWLGLESLTGTIEKGKIADLVILDENPLTDITNTRKIAGV